MAFHIDWNSESYPEIQDFRALIFFVFFFPLTRLILDRFLFEKLAKCLIFGKGFSQVNTISQRKRIDKFKESAWKFMYATSAEVLVILVIHNEPWFTNTRSFWFGPGDLAWPHLKMKSKLKFLYMYCGGFYIYAIFALIFWETRRSDFNAVMAHHLSTVVLIVMSYVFRMGRGGSVILALHEGSDVLLETAKMFKYSGVDVLASVFFALFALSFFILRLGLLPFWYLRNVGYDILFVLGKDKQNLEGMMHYYYCLIFLNGLLFLLLLLHIYWGWKILRMIVNQIRARGQVGNDVRSDSEDDDGEKEHKN